MVAISPVELRMSANKTVSRFRSPPLALRERSNWSDGSKGRADPLSGLLQLPQKRLPTRLAWPQAVHFGPRGNPHASQNEFVSLLSCPHRVHRIDNAAVVSTGLHQ
jgi:hypothetical protein